MRTSRNIGTERERSRRWWRGRLGSYPLHYYALVALLGVAVSVGAQPSAPPAVAPTVPSAPTPQGAGPAPGAPASPMDLPLQLADEARQVLQQVRDYSCVLISQERVRGQLQPQNVMEMKLRAQPFSIYLRWLEPRAEAGQEACYVAGRNGGMMRVHPAGFKGAIAGFVSIAPNDPRALESSRHTITDAGLAHLVGCFCRDWAQERQLNQSQVRAAEYTYNERRCTRVEITRPYQPNFYPYYRTVAYFDKETRLPIRVELYDWPRSGGAPGGDLLECYSYANLRLNVGVPDAVFNH